MSPTDPGPAEVYRIGVYVFISLTLALWDYAVTLDSEIRVIWQGPLNAVKVVFLFSRYLGLSTPIAMVTVFIFGFRVGHIYDHDTCQIFVRTLVVVAQTVTALLCALLCLRVYALYHKDGKIAALLGFLVLSTLVFGFVGGFSDLILEAESVGCIIQKPPDGPVSFLFLASVIVTQVTVAMLTFKRRQRRRPTETALILLVARDGAWTFVLICSIFTYIIIGSHFKGVMEPHVFFSVPVVLQCITTCRLILNVREMKLPEVKSEQRPREPSISLTQLTSFVEPTAHTAPDGIEEIEEIQRS